MSEPRVPLKNAVAEEAVLYLPPAYRPGMRALIRQVHGSEIERLRAALEKAAKIWQCYQHEPERAADKMATVVMLALERSPEETTAQHDPCPKCGADVCHGVGCSGSDPALPEARARDHRVPHRSLL